MPAAACGRNGSGARQALRCIGGGDLDGHLRLPADLARLKAGAAGGVAAGRDAGGLRVNARAIKRVFAVSLFINGGSFPAGSD